MAINCSNQWVLCPLLCMLLLYVYGVECVVSNLRGVALGTLLATNFVCNCICITHASDSIESPLIAGLHGTYMVFVLWSFSSEFKSTLWKMPCSSYTCVGLAVVIPLVGVTVCLHPLPFANDW